MSAPLVSAVVDTNLLVSGTVSKRGNPAALLDAWRRNAFLLLLSDAQRGEVTDVFSRPRIVERYQVPDDELQALFSLLETQARRVPLQEPLPLQVRDPKDNHILAAALGGRADYLVTGDDDLLSLAGDARLGPLEIVTVRVFLDVLPVSQ
jgi:putative PIN family toxin of toxin-antitoxin system